MIDDTLIIHAKTQGLGTNISLLSALFKTGKSINFYTDACGIQFLQTYKNLFDIKDDVLSIFADDLENTQHDCASDLSKLFSNYPDYKNIFVNGREHKIPNRSIKKPFIAMACYNNQHAVNYNLNNKFPANRTYTLNSYEKIFSSIKKAGYDVMVLDSLDISLSDKAFLLNEFCEALIAYEGGIAHLAHLLKIPTIILPWHHFPSGDDPGPNWDWFSFMFSRFHLDKRTYICKSVDEVISWSPEELISVINILHNEKGNNPLLSDDVTIFCDDEFNLKILPQNFILKAHDFFRPFDFFLHKTFFTKDIKLGGIKSITRVKDLHSITP